MACPFEGGLPLLETETRRQPFVTVGVTTYNRHDLLRQTLNSILAQSFGDFEVIVGNDYTAEVLTGEMIGITDPRVCFVNHPQNLREVGNMNALLGLATGRYFTWLFDDDLYELNFLQTSYDCLLEAGFPPAFFSSFRMLQKEEQFQPKEIHYRTKSLLSGREFLGRYSARQPAVVSTCGLFDTAVLRNQVGGVEELCASAIGVYCEYLFLVRCALLEKIVYVDAPFVLFRIHADSWSESPSEWGKYVEAGQELVRRGAEVLRHPSLAADFNANILMLCEQHLITIAHRSARIEVAKKKFGLFAIWRAFARYQNEVSSTIKNFVNQGGEVSYCTRRNLLNMNFNCYRIILLNLASSFYRSCRPLKNPNHVKARPP